MIGRLGLSGKRPPYVLKSAYPGAQDCIAAFTKRPGGLTAQRCEEGGVKKEYAVLASNTGRIVRDADALHGARCIPV